jgi:tRNA A37 threonylcarbamoyladenosine dehydratase
MDKQMKLWQMFLSNILVGAITGLIILAFTRAGDKVDKNDETIKSLAPYTYVDDRDGKLQTELEKKVDKESFQLLIKATDDMKNDVRDIKNFLLTNKPFNK